MEKFALWQQKIIQFFHDPPAKPFGGTPRTGTLKKIANDLFDAFQEHNKGPNWRHWYKSADWATAGADRPLLYVERKKGNRGLGSVSWPKDPVITHPLSAGCRLSLNATASLTPETPEREDGLEEPDGTSRDLIEEQEDVAKELAGHIPDWTNADMLQSGFMVLWRRYRDDLAAKFPNDPLWQEMPADSRTPDHSIWDHLKVTTALAFMEPHKMVEAPKDQGTPREPHMLHVSLGPVGAFIEQARTSRDLWISSYLLADLAWSAMEPLVNLYGPDCIVYPDLRSNPRADAWLKQHYPDALPEGTNPATYASVLPAAFVALVPRGGAGDLQKIEDLMAKSKEGVEARWDTLQQRVFKWFEKEVKPEDTAWKEIWTRQHQTPPVYLTWTAVPWRPLERIKNPDSLCGQALPAQKKRPPIDTSDAKAIDARRARLAPWMPQEVWAHYERTREVYAHSSLSYHQMERGFDYALTHHMLSVRHAQRKASSPVPIPQEGEPGETCTLCGQRQALHSGDKTKERLGAARQQAKQFWQNEKLDRDKTGHERLCAVCATKRFLVEADKGGEVFNHLWDGKTGQERYQVPFPSTATIAAQAFLAAVVKNEDCRAELAAVVEASKEALDRTSFPWTLPRLHAVADQGGEFLKYEAEDVLFPEVLDGKIAALKDKEKIQQYKKLRTAVQSLRKEAKKTNGEDHTPGTQIAVMRLDGDSMGRLLLGDPKVIGATWRDVLHPEAVKRLEDPNKAQTLRDAGWDSLLDSKRLMGPSLHAFVSRALRHFSNHIVPWVVEQEFSGRVIYTGGDDVLCFAPAAEALDIAARLQQLFSAPWVVDTKPEIKPWSWQRQESDWTHNPDAARRRFVIPDYTQGTIHLNKQGQRIFPHTAKGKWPETQTLKGHLFPLLGTGASLSAGIALGHYKTPLSSLLQRAKALEKVAKKKRASVAIGHASRGGTKTTFTMPWKTGENDVQPTAATVLNTVIKGFTSGALPGRLPYKLRRLAESHTAIPDGPGKDALLKGLFLSCLEDGEGKDLSNNAFMVWKRGLEKGNGEDGLLLCRALARGTGEEGEE